MIKIIVLAVIVLVALFIVTSPVETYVLELVMTMSDQYEFTFNPKIYVSQISRLTLYNGKSALTLKPYSIFGVEQIYLDVNASVFNVNGTLFFEGRFVFDTLADQKLTMYKAYTPENKTREVLLKVDAYLLLKMENKTDVEKTFSGEWPLTIE